MQIVLKCDNKSHNLEPIFNFVLNGVGLGVKLVSHRVILQLDADSFQEVFPFIAEIFSSTMLISEASDIYMK